MPARRPTVKAERIVKTNTRVHTHAHTQRTLNTYFIQIQQNSLHLARLLFVIYEKERQRAVKDNAIYING